MSHAETMRVFQRACVRAGVKVVYSQGFNPHLRMSLVLPRSVGVESDDEMLCLWLGEDEGGFDVELLKNRLAAELPEGIEIVSAQVSGAKRIPEPSLARYVITAKHNIEDMKGRIEGLMTSGEIVLDRRTGKGSKVKKIDVRPFLESINVGQKDIIVDCRVIPAGTIRVDEILDLLQINIDDLAGPVRRTMVRWQGIEQS